MKRLFLLLIAAPCFAQMNMSVVGSSVPVTAGGTGFSYKRSFTTDPTKCGAATNFPVLVYGSDATLKDVAHGGHVQSSTGNDLLFFADSGAVTQLASEVEFYDNVNGVFLAHVLYPLVSHTVGITHWTFYGKASPPSRTTNPWDANFKLRYGWPDGTTLSLLDSTINADTGNNYGAVPTTGKIDGGALVDQSALVRNSNVINVATGTVELWVYVTSYSGAGVIGGFSFEKYLQLDGSGIVTWVLWDGSSAAFIPSPSAISLNAWHHLVGTADGTTGILYIDGVAVASTAFGNTYTGYVSAPTVSFGHFLGTMDEGSVSSGARSGDWILTEYNNQSAPTTFLTWSAESAG
jgi:hypothetical protein